MNITVKCVRCELNYKSTMVLVDFYGDGKMIKVCRPCAKAIELWSVTNAKKNTKFMSKLKLAWLLLHFVKLVILWGNNAQNELFR